MGLIDYGAHGVAPFNYVAKKGFRGVKFGRVKNLGGVLLLSRW
jgi:hypothetical protein